MEDNLLMYTGIEHASRQRSGSASDLMEEVKSSEDLSVSTLAKLNGSIIHNGKELSRLTRQWERLKDDVARVENLIEIQRLDNSSTNVSLVKAQSANDFIIIIIIIILSSSVLISLSSLCLSLSLNSLSNSAIHITPDNIIIIYINQ